MRKFGIAAVRWIDAAVEIGCAGREAYLFEGIQRSSVAKALSFAHAAVGREGPGRGAERLIGQHSCEKPLPPLLRDERRPPRLSPGVLLSDTVGNSAGRAGRPAARAYAALICPRYRPLLA